MDEDVVNLIDSFKPRKGRWDFEPGDICVYREGIVKGKVEVLKKTIKDNQGEYLLRTIEKMGRFPLPQEFEVGAVFGYEGNYGWSLSPFSEEVNQ